MASFTLGPNLIGKEADEFPSEENVTLALPFADLLDWRPPFIDLLGPLLGFTLDLSEVAATDWTGAE
jgi:hypothetical protein